MKSIEFQYANALLVVAKNNDIDHTIYEAFKEKGRDLGNSLRPLNYFFGNPAIGAEKKTFAIERFFSIHAKIFKNFLSLMFSNGRFQNLVGIIMSYNEQYEKANKIKNADIITSTQVSDEMIEHLKNMISTRFSGFKLNFNLKIDPDILGGYKIVVDDTIIDNSLGSKMRKFLIS